MTDFSWFLATSLWAKPSKIMYFPPRRTSLKSSGFIILLSFLNDSWIRVNEWILLFFSWLFRHKTGPPDGAKNLRRRRNEICEAEFNFRSSDFQKNDLCEGSASFLYIVLCLCLNLYPYFLFFWIPFFSLIHPWMRPYADELTDQWMRDGTRTASSDRTYDLPSLRNILCTSLHKTEGQFLRPSET